MNNAGGGGGRWVLVAALIVVHVRFALRVRLRQRREGRSAARLRARFWGILFLTA